MDLSRSLNHLVLISSWLRSNHLLNMLTSFLDRSLFAGFLFLRILLLLTILLFRSSCVLSGLLGSLCLGTVVL